MNMPLTHLVRSLLWMNTMSSQKRSYQLKARAEHQQQTRQRIVTAAAQLHEEVGPVRTTVAEIARRAGARRLTVYHPFPDERDLFTASQGHFLAEHPPPDPTAALAIPDPAERLRAVLRGFYVWYRTREPVFANVQRDRLVLPALDTLLQHTVDAQLAALADTLAASFATRGEHTKRVRAAVALALDFWTWRCLAHQGLDDGPAADLMVDAVTTAARHALT
jgi:AcrR family transcriptional regulator